MNPVNLAIRPSRAGRRVDVLVPRLKSNENGLGSIYLYDMQATNEDIEKLAVGLASNTNVELLFLSCNHIGQRGMQALVNHAFHENSKISRVFLSRNSLGVEGCRILSRFLSSDKCTTLRELYLAGNRISNIGVACLAKGLATNNSLEKLDLRDNGINDGTGINAIGKILGDSHSLKWLYLWGNPAVSECCMGKDNNDEPQWIPVYGHNTVMNGIRKHFRLTGTPSSIEGVCVGCHALQKQIQSYVAWSRLGRDLLKHHNLPPALWAHYMGMIQGEPSLLYEVLCSKPDVMKRQSNEQEKKRKHDKTNEKHGQEDNKERKDKESGTNAQQYSTEYDRKRRRIV